ncbi:MAG: flagellar motor switch protein FliN [Planctomycetota bacterium]
MSDAAPTNPNADAAGEPAAPAVADAATADVKAVDFASFSSTAAGHGGSNIDLLLDVDVEVSAEIGSRQLPIEQLLALGPGAVVELDRSAEQPIDLKVNGKIFARGEVVVVGDHFGVRVTEIVKPTQAK